MKFKVESLLYSPFLRVSFTWLWMLVSPLIVALVGSSVLGLGLGEFIDYVESHRSLMVYLELVSVGLVPFLFTLLSRESFSEYGVKLEGIRESLVSSVLFVSVVYGFSYVFGGQLLSLQFPQTQLSFPWNIWNTFLGLLAYGPLEVFFIIWLIDNTDKSSKAGGETLSVGLLVTVVAFAMLHIITTRNLVNSVNIIIIFLFFGLVYKSTDNSVGPMIAWTLVNRQALIAASLVFI